MFKFTRSLLVALIATGLSAHSFAETINVTNTNDSGAGSLRQAINDANANVSFSTILINIPGTSGSERIINVPTALPNFTAPVDLKTDAAQNGKTVLLAPVINGPGAATTGLTFSSGSANSSVSLITFRTFVFSIVLNTGSITVLNNSFENNQGGIDVRPVSSGGNTIRGNVFTTTNTGASAFAGISTGNVITGNSFNGTGINLSGGGNTIGGPGNADPNTFNNTPGSAINLENGSGALIQHNTINGSKGAGITFVGTTNIDVQVLSNNFSNNVGWDISVQYGYYFRIVSNQITGDNGIFNGISLQNGLSYAVTGNTVSGGSIELQSTTSSFQYGTLTVQNNTIVNDPNGFSGHGALSLTSVTNALVSGNTIHNNGGNGIYLITSTNNTLVNNTIYENFRVGVYAGNLLNNKISRNVIEYNHADVYGGRTGIYATAKTAPSITSAKRVGNNFVITGTGTVANDTVEIFLSDRATRNGTLVQNALSFLGAVKATGTTWTATLTAVNLNSTEVYFLTTATDINNTTSGFSTAISVEINGPTSATTNHTSTYFAEYLPGASYSWWSTLPISSMTTNGNQASFNFNQVGIGTVSVGYTDPTTGLWKQYSLAVTVFGAARTSDDNAAPIAQTLAYPNPFVSTTHVTVEGTDNISLQLFDDKGTPIYSSEGHAHGTTVELGNELHPGIYTLKTISGGNVSTTRIVKAQ
ncbi:MAG: hemagglutination domain protein [Chitinophagaceae bacterium]|nr:hemagglutination domain protein [Chitinophagaceae bacterium]